MDLHTFGYTIFLYEKLLRQLRCLVYRGSTAKPGGGVFLLVSLFLNPPLTTSYCSFLKLVY